MTVYQFCQNLTTYINVCTLVRTWEWHYTFSHGFVCLWGIFNTGKNKKVKRHYPSREHTVSRYQNITILIVLTWCVRDISILKIILMKNGGCWLANLLFVLRCNRLHFVLLFIGRLNLIQTVVDCTLHLRTLSLCWSNHTSLGLICSRQSSRIIPEWIIPEWQNSVLNDILLIVPKSNYSHWSRNEIDITHSSICMNNSCFLYREKEQWSQQTVPFRYSFRMSKIEFPSSWLPLCVYIIFLSLK